MFAASWAFRGMFIQVVVASAGEDMVLAGMSIICIPALSYKASGFTMASSEYEVAKFLSFVTGEKIQTRFRFCAVYPTKIEICGHPFFWHLSAIVPWLKALPEIDTVMCSNLYSRKIPFRLLRSYHSCLSKGYSIIK